MNQKCLIFIITSTFSFHEFCALGTNTISLIAHSDKPHKTGQINSCTPTIQICTAGEHELFWPVMHDRSFNLNSNLCLHLILSIKRRRQYLKFISDASPGLITMREMNFLCS